MIEILRCEKPGSELLSRKWRIIADKIEPEATSLHHSGSAQLLMNIVEISKKAIGVGNGHLCPHVCALHVATSVEIKDTKIFRGGAWLCFPDELETLIYLRHHWLREIRKLSTALVR